ncbi:hypothetical protein ACFY3J_34930 [Streptomyces sp. NPDC001231]
MAPVDTDRRLTPAARQAVQDGIPDSYEAMVTLACLRLWLP